MDLEQFVKNLQAQNAEFQALILNLSKGQDELKSLLTKKKEAKKPKGVLNLRRRFKGPLKKAEEAKISKDNCRPRFFLSRERCELTLLLFLSFLKIRESPPTFI